MLSVRPCVRYLCISLGISSLFIYVVRYFVICFLAPLFIYFVRSSVISLFLDFVRS